MCSLGAAALSPLIRHTLHISTTQAGLIPSTVFLGALTMSVAAGRLTDALGGPAAALLALLLAAGAMLVAAIANTGALFFAGILLVGWGYGLLNPAANALAGATIAARRRGLAMSLKQVGVTVGGALGGLVLAPLAGTVASWRIALFVPIGVCVATALWALTVQLRAARGIARPRPRTSQDPLIDTGATGRAAPLGGVPAHPHSAPVSPRRHLRPSSSAVAVVAVSLYGFAMAGMQLGLLGYLSQFLTNGMSFTAGQAGLAYFATLTAGTIGRLCWGLISDRSGGHRNLPLAAAAVGSAVGFVLLAYASSGFVWVALVLIGLCGVGWNGIYQALVVENATAGRIGRASARSFFFIYGGSILLPPLVGVSAGGGSAWRATWLMSAAISVVAGAAMAYAHQRRPAESSPT